MSRKVHADKSEWSQASLYAFMGGYGPFKPRGPQPIDNVVVVFKHRVESSTSTYSHPLYSMAGEVQALLLSASNETETILVVDLTTMVEDVPAALKKEETETDLTKGFGRTLLRLFERLRLHQVTFVAYQECCPLVIKLIRALDPTVCPSLWLLHPVLSPKFVNLHLVGNTHKMKKQKNIPDLHLVFETELARDKRLQMLRHIYPEGTVQILDKSVEALLLASLEYNASPPPVSTYDPDYCNDMGKSLFPFFYHCRNE